MLFNFASVSYTIQLNQQSVLPYNTGILNFIKNITNNGNIIFYLVY